MTEMIKELIKKYFEKEDVKYYLPLIESTKKNDIDNKGRQKLWGANASFRHKEFKDLSEGKKVNLKDGKNYILNSYEKALYYELNINAIEECLMVIDIDEEGIKEEEKEEWINKNIPEIIRNLPYTISRTKKLPHYYLILEGVNKEILRNKIKTITECLTFCKGDILCSHVWEKTDGLLYNYQGEIPKIHIEEIKEYLKKETLMKFELNEKESDIEEDETDTMNYIKEEIIEEDEITNEKTINLYENKKSKREEDEISEITYEGEVKNNIVDINILKEYLNGLKEERYDNYEYWSKIVWGIANISRDNNWTLTIRNELIHEFSKKSSKYDENRVNDFINNNIKKIENGIKIGTIIEYYKEDNEGEIIKKSNEKEITLDYILNNNIRDSDISKYIKNKLGGNYVCSDINKNIWYIFENHKWVEDDNGITIFKKISEIIPQESYNKQIYYTTKLIEINREIEEIGEIEKELKNNETKSTEIKNMLKNKILEKNKINNILSKITKLIDKCKNRTGKINIFKELKDEYYVKKFIDNLDVNPYIICCNNGVIDFKMRKFRPGKPSDMCSMSTRYNYISLDTIKKDEKLNKKYNDIMDFMEKLFVIPGILTYVYEHLASVLIGEAKEQDFNYYMGKGSNGKTMLVNLMGKVLGDYYGIVPTALICSKKANIGTCTSEIALLRGIRYAVMQEPTLGEIMNEGSMKELTGQSPILCNPKNKTPFYFTPMFKLVICANFTLNIKSDDDGTWRRIKVIDFLSKFKYDADEEEIFEFEKDIDLKDKLDDWKEIFLAILTEKAFELNGKINENEFIKKATLRYREEQNKIGIYITENIEFIKENEIEIEELGENFKSWFEMNYRTKIGLKYLLDLLANKYENIIIKKHTIKGIKLKEECNEKKNDEDIFIEEFNKQFEIITDVKKNDEIHYIKTIRISEWARLKNLKIYTSKSINKILLEKLNYDTKIHLLKKSINNDKVWIYKNIKEKNK